MALGVNISVSRLGSVVNANTVPYLYNNYSLGFAFLTGSLVCVFSFINAVGLCSIDLWAEKKNPNGGKAAIADEEKFQWKDVWSFKLPFWLLTISCVVTYMSVFPYI
jgi:hypothetical protein